MKVIFLDVDGPLNTDNYLMEQCKIHPAGRLFAHEAQRNFPPYVMENLAKIVNDDPNTKIVISSTWRLHLCGDGVFEKYLEDESTVEDDDWHALMRNLKVYGLKDKVIGVTPVLPYDKQMYVKYMRCSNFRGDEIKAWLRENRHLNITSIVIIDDDTDMVDMTDTHLALCDFLDGITESVTKLALRILRLGGMPKL